MSIARQLLAFVILATVSSSTFALEGFSKAEPHIVGLHGIIDAPATGASAFSVTGLYGKYIQRRMVGFVGLSVMGGSGMSTKIGASLWGQYYLKPEKTGEFVPFATVGANVVTGGSSTSLFVIGGGGASYFLSDRASFDGRLLFRLHTFSTGGGSNGGSFGYDGASFEMGLSQRF